MMAAYYNELKPEAAHMLRQLIRDGLIADGEVDDRSITEVHANDIKGFTQHHFFAGIGGWSVALRLAGWDDARPVWTGSCPCQPFSGAGKQKGHGDERHLWPHWARLIRECRPSTIFGEQVAGAVAFGWWDDVAADLEAEGYACAAAVLPACSVGKPHKRDRLWFVGNAQHDGRHGRQVGGGHAAAVRDDTQGQNCTSQSAGTSEPSNVADGNSNYAGRRPSETGGAGQEIWIRSSVDSANAGLALANTYLTGLEGRGRHEQQHGAERRQDQDGYAGAADLRWLDCPDGKQRPVEPSICLLAYGIQHRASLLHGYGNAIVPSLAAAFIKATGL